MSSSPGRTFLTAFVKEGGFEDVDLTLLSIDFDEASGPLQMRRMPLCARPPFANETVVVASRKELPDRTFCHRS